MNTYRKGAVMVVGGTEAELEGVKMMNMSKFVKCGFVTRGFLGRGAVIPREVRS